MKRGYVSPFQLGVLSGAQEAMKIAEEHTGERGANIENIFYASAFQAGVDEFLLPRLDDLRLPDSDFIRSRITIVEKEASKHNWAMVENAFSAVLPPNWRSDERYSRIWTVQSFVVDLLEAMRTKSSMLVPGGLPDRKLIESLLPSELGVPVLNLFDAMEETKLANLFPGQAVAVDSLKRFDDVLRSDLFRNLTVAQSNLDDAQAEVAIVLPAIIDATQAIYAKNRALFSVRAAAVGMLQLTPKLIDGVLGKLPGVLAETAAKLGIEVLESRRRIVVYDCKANVYGVLISNVLRMLKAKENSPQP